MSRPVKEMITADLRERYAEVDSACVVALVGLNVEAQESLRVSLAEKSARLEVVKNSLARKAFADTLLAPLGESLQGPCALVTSKDSLIEAAKILVAAAKETTELALKQAILEGDPELLTVVQIAGMKSRPELIGEVALLIGSPGRAIAGCLCAPQAKIAGCLKAIAGKAA